MGRIARAGLLALGAALALTLHGCSGSESAASTTSGASESASCEIGFETLLQKFYSRGLIGCSKVS